MERRIPLLERVKELTFEAVCCGLVLLIGIVVEGEEKKELEAILERCRWLAGIAPLKKGGSE